MKGWRWLMGWKPWAVLAAVVAAYAAAGFLAAPRLLRASLTEHVATAYGRTLDLGAIRFNPFTFRLEVEGLMLPDADGQPMLGVGRLVVDFEASSLWRGALTFREISVTHPLVRLETRADGRFNLADLAPPAGEVPGPGAGPEEPLPVLIESLEVQQGEVHIVDLSLRQPFRATLKPRRFVLRDFRTRAGGGNAGEFTAQSLAGERLSWRGRLEVAPFRSTGTLEFDGLEAATVLRIADSPLPFDVPRGSIDLMANYEFVAGEPLRFDVTVPTITLSDFAFKARDADAEWVTLPKIEVSGTRFSLQQRSVAVDKVAVAGARVAVWLEPGGALNLGRLAGPPAAEAEPAPAAAAKPAAETAPRPWSLSVATIEVRDAGIAAEDRSVSPTVALTVAPISLDVAGWSNAPGAAVDVRTDMGLDGGGHFAADGRVPLDSLAAELRLRLQGLDLSRFQPYVAQSTGLIVRQGSLDAEGKLALTEGAAPASFDGIVSLGRLHVIDSRLREDLLKWDRLDVRGIRYVAKPAALAIESIVARRPYARVLIASDGTLNLSRAFEPPATGGEAAGPTDGAAAAAAAPAPAANAGSRPLRARIGRVQFADGTVDFADLSLTPNFQAAIQALNGTVVGLSSDPAQRAQVDLKGQVDRFSPVVIAGEVNYLAATSYTDIALSFRNMELTTFNPYSTKWAGYHIAKGKLTTELRYKVENRQLDAQHHITIDQLEFGERTNSPDAITLPLKLAVALLKDRNGLIDLDVPVTGSLDDPQFRVGPIVWKIIKNLLVKIVTAPFALLGSLFGGGPDINLLDFAPGSAALDAAAQGKLSAVAKGLAERPQLKLEVPLTTVPELDRPALQAAKFEARLAEVVAAGGRKSSPAVPAVSDPDERLRGLEQWYRAEFGRKPEIPPPPGDDPKVVREQAAQPAYRSAWLEEQLLAVIEVADAELQALAKGRSDAVLAALLGDGAIDPARIFVTAARPAAAEGAAVRMELKLE